MRISLLVCFVTTIVTPPVSQGVATDSYAAIVEQYRVAPDDASRRMLAMAPQDLDRAIEAATAPDSRWTEDALDAALLMHTDAAAFLANRRDTTAWMHVERAESLSVAAARDTENTWFVHRWYSAVARAFPHDARIRPMRERWERQPWQRSAVAFQQALWLETKGATEPTMLAPFLDSHVYGPSQFRHALALYRRALAGGMTGAALHIGRIEMLLGRAREARSFFTTAAEQSRAPQTRYLARLFLGSLDELAGRPDTAEQRYRAALLDVPHAQSGRLALAALLARNGRSAEAARAIADHAPDQARQRPFDPWWLYLPPDSDDFAVMMATLYAEIRR